MVGDRWCDDDRRRIEHALREVICDLQIVSEPEVRSMLFAAGAERHDHEGVGRQQLFGVAPRDIFEALALDRRRLSLERGDCCGEREAGRQHHCGDFRAHEVLVRALYTKLVRGASPLGLPFTRPPPLKLRRDLAEAPTARRRALARRFASSLRSRGRFASLAPIVPINSAPRNRGLAPFEWLARRGSLATWKDRWVWIACRRCLLHMPDWTVVGYKRLPNRRQVRASEASHAIGPPTPRLRRGLAVALRAEAEARRRSGARERV